MSAFHGIMGMPRHAYAVIQLLTAPGKVNACLGRPSQRLYRVFLFERSANLMLTGVYSITNTKSGKRYIGSAVNIKKRWERHKVDLRAGKHHSRHLQSAWNKYGESAFRFEIVATCEPGDLIAQEQFWIDAFQTANGKHGYNVVPKAGSNLGRKASDETRAKLSLSHKGYKPSDETRAKLSVTSQEMHKRPDVKARIIAALTGKRHSPEAKAKMSASRAGWQYSPETRARMSAAARKRKASDETRSKMTAAQLGQDGANAKLTDSDIPKIRELLSSGMSQEKIAKIFGVSASCISHVKLGKNWSHIK